MIKRGTFVRAGLGVAILTLAACGGGENIPKKSSRVIVPSITVKGQSIVDQTVTIKRAEIAEPGFVVIHEMIDGKVVVPQSVGAAHLNKGLNVNVKIPLTKVIKPGAQLLAMLHNDTGKIGAYEFDVGSTDVDTPIIHEGKPVVRPFPTN